MDPISAKQLFTHKRSEGSKRDRQGKKSKALWACSLRGASFSYSFLAWTSSKIEKLHLRQ